MPQKKLCTGSRLSDARQQDSAVPLLRIQPVIPSGGCDRGLSNALGLFRRDMLTEGQTRTIGSLFADLRSLNRGQLIGEDPKRDTQGVRLLIDRSVGQGSCDLYRIGSNLSMIALDCLAHAAARTEVLPGEGLLEFQLRVSGSLVLSLAKSAQSVVVKAPCMLMMYQPPGVDVPQHVLPGSRDTGVTLYCNPQFLAELTKRNGIAPWPQLDEIAQCGPQTVWYRQEELSPTLLNVAHSLLRNPYEGGVRLLRAEAIALELLCEILSCSVASTINADKALSEQEARQLDSARRMLASQASGSPRTRDVARAVGMSESKLKRAFKARFGVTVFEFGLECRMRRAVELLRSKHMQVGQVARAVGYAHQTSFTAAFAQYFGFLPNQARKRMH